jgi:hypothetical protein
MAAKLVKHFNNITDYGNLVATLLKDLSQHSETRDVGTAMLALQHMEERKRHHYVNTCRPMFLEWLEMLSLSSLSVHFWVMFTDRIEKLIFLAGVLEMQLLRSAGTVCSTKLLPRCLVACHKELQGYKTLQSYRDVVTHHQRRCEEIDILDLLK